MVKILAIDGGGIRGIIPALVLAEIERRTGKGTAELFDLIAGTSAGGIIALGLTRPSSSGEGKPEHTAKELCRLFKEDGHRVFERSIWRRIGSVSVWSGVEVRCEEKREGLWGRIGKGGNDGIRI